MRAFLASAVLLVGCYHSQDQSVSTQVKVHESVVCENLDHYFVQALGGPYNVKPEITNYVNRIASRVITSSDYKKVPFEIVVLNHSTPFAMAFANHHIAFSRGLLTLVDNEAQLASLIAYYIHNACKLKECSKEVFEEVENALSSSRKIDVEKCTQKQALSQEESCKLQKEALLLVDRLGYDPKEALTILEKLAQTDAMRYMPHLAARTGVMIELLQTHSEGGYQGTEGHLEMIEPLLKVQKAYELYDLGVDAFERKDYSLAHTLVSAAIVIEEKESLFHIYLGRALKKLGRPERAIKSFNRALELNNLYYWPYFERAKVHKQLEKFDRAKFDYESAIDLYPSAYFFSELTPLR